ncbi:hypothetical protein STVA_11310 [Allostella vacuolata]|nr:hypothetical protein STVA_11310 [Stella vacuolata]
MTGDLAAIVRLDLARPVPAAARALADHLAARSPAVAGILFYGSVLRDGDTGGLLDLYVLVDSLRAWHGAGWRAVAGRLLPPDVSYVEVPHEGGVVRAKVAVLRLDRFHRAAGPEGLDGTIWARFAQPSALVHWRDGAARDRVEAAVVRAVVTGARWAALLGPEAGDPLDFWRTLFAHTYRAELRVERAGRALEIVDHAPARYRQMLVPAWAEAGIEMERRADGTLSPRVGPAARRRARRTWHGRAMAGKALNLVRLVKAAFTFTDGGRYLAWKIERHSGTRLDLTPWQLRHPVLAGPAILWRLWRRGVVR